MQTLVILLSQIQDDVERVVAYCSRALRPSQRRYCTTKREMLAAVAMCIQFRSYLRGAKFTLHTDHKSLVWLHQFKDTEGMMARWLHALQQFHFSIIHRAGDDHGNADGLSRAPASPCRQCTRPDCPPVVSLPVSTDQYRFHSIAYLMCYRYAMINGQKTFATGICKWSSTSPISPHQSLRRLTVYRSGILY